VITVAPNAAGAAGSSAMPTTCVPVVGVFPGRPIPNWIDVDAPEAQKTSSSFSFIRGVVAAPGWQSSIRIPAADTDADAREMEYVSIYAAIGLKARVSAAAEIVKLSPIATVRETARSSLPRNVPPDVADQNETCVYVSAVPTFVQLTSAEFVIEPDAAAEHVTATRVVLPAAFAVPADPGSPVWSLTQKAAGGVQATALASESRMLFAMPLASPVVIYLPSVHCGQSKGRSLAARRLDGISTPVPLYAAVITR
jgi:hypothetical protein